jgi:hypothetical protein
MGWLEENVELMDMEESERGDEPGIKFLHAMSFAPPLGRGVSWALEGSWMDMDVVEADE